MKINRVFSWSLVIALGGFLFGFDTAVISGAEQSIQAYWMLSPFAQGLTISIALIGTVIGSLLGAIPSDKWGRKNTLYIIAGLYLLSSLGSALSENWYLFLVFRFLGGLGVGASSVTAPIYISEIAPAGQRGRLVALFQFNVVFGILVSYLSNYLIGQLGGEAWRLMLGVQAVPSLLFLVLLRFIPESPRWLVLRKGRIEAARQILEKIDLNTAAGILRAIQSHAAGIRDTQVHGGGKKLQTGFFGRQNRRPVILAILIAMFNQLSGINAVIYYAPRIFEMAGLGKSSALLSTTGLGLINFIFTLLAMRFIDKIGRRTLMIIGSFGLIITLSMVSYCFYNHLVNSSMVPVFLLLYIAFFAFSQGAVIWVFISEIFPNRIRAKGQTLGSTTHWLMAAIITFLFPYLTKKMGGGHTFLFFAVMMCLQLIFSWKLMPETKGKSLEQIEEVVTHL